MNMNPMLVIDASVAVKFVSNEGGRAEALSYGDEAARMIAPDWLRVEVAHTLWRKVSMELLSREQAEQAAQGLPDFFDHFHLASELLVASYQLAFELKHGIYDCLYLALAIREDCSVLTADRKFWNAAKRGGLGARIELLTWAGQRE
jgi:predicted nucleic acid-binding protein